MRTDGRNAEAGVWLGSRCGKMGLEWEMVVVPEGGGVSLASSLGPCLTVAFDFFLSLQLFSV